MPSSDPNPIEWLHQRLRSFLFTPTGPTNLGFCRFLFFGYLLYLYARLDTAPWADVSQVFWAPVSFFDLLHLPVLPKSGLEILDIVWKIAVALSCVGLLTRTSTMTSFVLGVYLLGLPQNFGKISHRPGLLVLVMGVLALSRCGDAWSLDRLVRRLRRRHGPNESSHVLSGEYRWPIRFVWLLMALAFLGAGVSKMYYGSGWFGSQGLRYVMISHQYLADEPLLPWGLYLAQYAWVCALLAACTVVAEASAPLAVISWRLRLVIVPGLFMLQLGNAIVIGIHSDFAWAACYSFWVPWDRVGNWLASRFAS